MNRVLERPASLALDAAAAAAAEPTWRADPELWRALAALFDAHPAWSARSCRALLQAWCDARCADPWQARLLRYWARWTQHHRELRQGLAGAGLRSWAEACRYCEVWSAVRPAMSPFCGVAAILADALEELPAHYPGPPACAPASGAHDGVVLVVSNDASRAGFAQFGSARQLAWALERSAVPWRLCRPAAALAAGGAMLDPVRVRAVVFCSFRHRSGDFAWHAMAVEAACRARGIAVINSIRAGWDVRHSAVLARLQGAGVRCPRFQQFGSIEHITLGYPLILRVDGLHCGQHMVLVRDAAEARACLAAARGRFLLDGAQTPAPNLAIEYIDVADRAGRFHKYRAYVVGGRVLVRHKVVGAGWLVNFGSADSCGGAAAARAHLHGAEGGDSAGDTSDDEALLARAGRASGSDVTALDYARTRDGALVVWEANRLFKMNGDPGYEGNGVAPPEGAGSDGRRAAADRRLGEALLAMLRERLSLQ